MEKYLLAIWQVVEIAKLDHLDALDAKGILIFIQNLQMMDKRLRAIYVGFQLRPLQSILVVWIFTEGASMEIQRIHVVHLNTKLI